MKYIEIALILLGWASQTHCQSWEESVANTDSVIKANRVKTQYLYVTNKVDFSTGMLDSISDRLLMRSDFDEEGRVITKSVEKDVTYFHYDETGNLTCEFGTHYDSYYTPPAHYFFQCDYIYDLSVLKKEIRKFQHPLDSTEDKVLTVEFNYHKNGLLSNVKAFESSENVEKQLVKQTDYFYDAMNQKTKTEYYYLNQQDELKHIATITFQYDNEGNMTGQLEDGLKPKLEGVKRYYKWLYQYSPDNKLFSKTQLSGNDTNSLKIIKKVSYTETGQIDTVYKYAWAVLDEKTVYTYKNNKLSTITDIYYFKSRKPQTNTKLELIYDNKTGLLKEIITSTFRGYFYYTYF